MTDIELVKPPFEGPEPTQADVETKKKVGDFTVIPIALLSRRDLTMGAKMVVSGVFYAQSRADMKGNLEAIISELCGISVSKARGYIAELQLAGVLRRKLPVR
jgi:hypothetical protein